MSENPQDFVHLHLHTQYSLLDGFAQINRAVKRASQLQMSALAITDHGTMFGVIDFYRACKKAEIKPIIGVEAYLARRGMTDRESDLDRQSFHMLLLAKDEIGYKNLCKIASASQLDGYYYRPRIDKDFLAAHAQGIIATSGCLAAEIPRLVADGREDEARKQLGWYQDVFGKENFFIELQQHDIPELETLNRWLLENYEYANVPLVATNDVHYVNMSDHDVHDTLLCIQTSELKSSKKRMMMTDPSYHLRTQAEMWEIFGDIAPQALTNTLLIAEMCQAPDFDDKKYHLPIFPVPDRFASPDEYLRYLCDKGAEWRFGDRAYSETIQNRINHEIGIINTMGFPTYFLIVWDLCQFAKSADIWWNVRGSGAGSIVAYVLGITSLDPLENALIFERFLNPERISMPDFDIDFPEDRRAEMIEYCARKYGEDKVAAIITFGTLKPKAAIRDVGRALEMPLSEVNSIAKLVPTVPKPPTIEQLLGLDPAQKEDEEKKAYTNPDMVALYAKDAKVKEVLDYAMKIEGVPRHAGTHAAGIIVSDKPLVEYLPLHRPTTNDEDNVSVHQLTQFPMETAESIGLLKIDFLGLSTLTIMRRACELIERYHGIVYDMDNIPYKPDPEDPEVSERVAAMFEMLGRGDTVGVFQLESSGMRQTLMGMKPKTFEHVIAAIALYRPGPLQFIPLFNDRMHGKVKVEYKHPKLESIIGNTYGIITYQEQIMQIAMELFGYSAGEADSMRRAVSKKKAADLQKHRSIFMERGPENGVDADTASKIFDEIDFFANYGFNKSHAADYAVITCQTGYLKCHYPHEYLTAMLSVQRDDSDKVGLFIQDAREKGIRILAPDINQSHLDFTIEEDVDDPTKRHIRFGLGAIKNLGVGAIEYIIRERNARGMFKNLDDFLNRCSANEIGKRGIEAMVRVGALGNEFDRNLLLHNLERLMKYSNDRQKDASTGQKNMFDLLGGSGAKGGGSIADILQRPPIQIDEREYARWEKELVGIYLQGHPTSAVLTKLRGADMKVFTAHELRQLEEQLPIEGALIVGLVGEIRTPATKMGEAMGILTVEDETSRIECVAFPRTWAKFRTLVVEEAVLLIWGRAESRNGDVQIIIDRIDTQLDLSYSNDVNALVEATKQFSWLNNNEDDADIPLFMDTSDFGDDPEEDNTPAPFVVPRSGNSHGNGNGKANGNGVAIKGNVLEATLPAVNPSAKVVDEIVAEQDYLENDDDWQELPPDNEPQSEPDEEPSFVPMSPIPPPMSPRRRVVVRQQLVITLERSDDTDADFRKLRWIYSKAMSFPGTDELRVYAYYPQTKERYQLDFRKLTIEVCDALIAELVQEVGEHNLQIREI